MLNRYRLGLIFLFFCIDNAPAQQAIRPPLGPPSDLRTAEEQHAAVVAPIAARRDERLRAAKAAYATALDEVQRAATTRGDLDTALAAKSERERLAAAGAPESAKALPKAVLPHRQRFDAAVAQAQAGSNREEAAQIKSYLAILDALQTRITKQGDLEAAAEIKRRRATIGAQLAAIESGKGTAPLPAFEANPPAVPALPSAAPGAGLSIPPIPVASSLKAKGGAAEVSTDAVVFDGPPGDGRRGAKGILFKSDSAAAAAVRAGSTWAFRYTRGGSAWGVQIIHPAGRGQAIAHLDADRVGLSTPETWREVGYRDSDGKRIRKTQAFEKIFPLRDGLEYTVVSRLSTGGAYELFLNGELVATGRASSGSPLDLGIPEGKTFPGSGRGTKLEFKGAGGMPLPLKWSPGWSGILLGPMDSGEHICSDLRFYAGVADVGAAKR